MYHPHIICVVETWLSQDIENSEIAILGFQLFRYDRNRHGGGILVYVNDLFSVSLNPFPSSPLELISFSIRFFDAPILICVFYRQPSTNRHIFDKLCSYLQSIGANRFANFVCLGDYNVNYDDVSHPLFSDLCAFSSSFCLSQTVVGPTHNHHNGSESTIDLVFVSSEIKEHRCETIPPLANSDHNGILAHLYVNSSSNNIQPQPCKGRLIWRYNFADWPAACNLIQQFDWETILSGDIDQVWETWLHTFMSIMKQTVPNAILNTRRNLPWLNKSIVQLIRRRNMLFKQAKRSGNFSKYKNARNRTVSKLRAAKKRYFKQLCPKNLNDSGRL